MTNRKLSPPKYRFDKLMISLFFIFAGFNSLYAQDPSISISPTDTTICADLNTFYINFATVTNDSAVKWTHNGSGSFTTTINETTYYLPSAGDKSSGIVTLKLYAYPIFPSTHIDSITLLLQFTDPPIITNPGNQAACNSYILPAIAGTNLSGGQAYYTSTGAGGTKYIAGASITSTQTLYIYDSIGTCYDQENFTITITNSPAINDIADQSVCDSYTLPTITGTNLSGNQAFYTLSSGLGVKHVAGDAITSSTTLYIYDINGSCSNEQNFTITVTNTPIVTDIPDQIVCDNYTLPAITGTNLSGNQAYYTASGGVGTKFIAGQVISTTRTLFIYDSNGSCSDEEQLTITVNATPVINNPGNQVECDSYILPGITGVNLSGNQAYYTLTAGGGTKYIAGQSINASTTLYIYDTNGSCSDEENFTISIIASPIINDIANPTVCDSYVLPTITGTNLSGNQAYYTASGGAGTKYNAGQTISTSTTLYIYDTNGNCSDEENFTITIVSAPAINDITDQSVCDSYTLPTITGSNLSGNEAYYTFSGGLGVQYNATDIITSTTTLYIYDINGSCSDEQSFTITVTNTPVVNDISNPTACDSYTLPAITGTNLTGNQAYYTASGGVGTKFVAGDVITTTRTLYIYDSNGSCDSEEQFTITVNATSIITNQGNQAVCDTYTLPTITGSYLSGGQAYYTAPAGGGTRYNAGVTLGTSATLYIYDTNGSCSDQEQFSINITHSPDITNPGNQVSCNTYTLPVITGTNLSGNQAYYTASLGGGTKYNIGNVISSSTFLYIYDSNGTCDGEENFTVTILPPPVITDPGNQIACGSYTLPVIIGTNLSGNQAYYTASGGNGTRYDAGDAIVNSDILFIYDNNGSCSDEETFNITIQPIANVNAGANTSLCGLTAYTLQGSAAYHDNTTISWSRIQGGGSLSPTDELHPIYTPVVGDYGNTVQLRLTVSGLGPCSGTTYTDDVFLYYSDHIIVNAGPATAIICETDTYTTQASSNTPSTYQWRRDVDGDGTFDDDQILNPTYTPGPVDIAKGTVTLTLEATGAGTCLGNSIDQIVLQIKSLPTVNAGPASATICATDTYTTSDATASNHDSQLWSILSGGGSISNSSSLNSAQYIPGQAAINQGYAILRLTVTSLSPCFTTDYDEIRINITNEPEITVGTIPTLCQGIPYTVSIADTNYSSTVSWTLVSGTGVLINATTINPTYTPSANDAVSGSIVLQLTASANSPCTASTIQSITFPVVGIPTVELGTNITVCETTSSIVLNPTVTNGISYLWTTSGNGTFSPNSSIQNPTYNPSDADKTAGTIMLKLVVTGEALCSSAVSDSLNVIFTPAPAAYVIAKDSICVGNSYFISSAVANNESSIVWSHDGNGSLNGVGLEKPTYTSVAADAGKDITLTMRVNGNGSCTYVEDQLVLSVLRPPTVYTGPDIYICGSSFQISEATANYQDGLQWTTSGNGTFDVSTNLNPKYTLGSNDIAAGFVQLTLTATANSPCAVDASDSFVINLVDAPIANAGPDITLCETQNYVTSSATAPNATSYLWEIMNGSGILNNATSLQGATYAPSNNDKQLGSFTLKLTAYGNISCPSSSDQVTITISKQAIVNAGSPTEVCVGIDFTVSGASVSNASSYIWTTNGHGTLTNVSTLTPTYTPTINDLTVNGGVISLILTAVSSSPCMGNVVSTKSLTVYKEPTAYAGAAAYVCAGTTYDIQSATATYASDYVWASSSGGIFTNNHTLTPTYQVNSTDASTTWVDITLTAVPKSPCATPASHTFRLTVLPGPVSDAGANSTICADEIYTNSDADTTNATTILWQTSGDGYFSSNTAIRPSYTPGTADKINGTVTLTLHAYGLGSNGCNHDVSDLNLTINKVATANSGSMTSICEGSNVIQGASVSNNNGQYWRVISGTGTLLNSTSLTPIYNTSPGDVAAGTIVLELIALPLSSCSDSAFRTLSLDVIEAPTAYAGADTTVCGQTPYHLWGATSNSLTNTFVWTKSGTGVFSDINSLNPIYAPSAADVALGAVTLTLTASNGSCNDAIDVMTLTLASTVIEAGADAISCVNTNYTANGTIIGNYVSVLWTENGIGSIVPGTESTLNPIYQPHSNDAGTTITMTMTVVKGAPCSGNIPDAFYLEIKPEPTATLGNDTTICENELLTIPGGHAIATNYTNISWTTAGDGTFSSGGLTPTYYPGTNDLLVGFVELQIHVVNAPCLEATDEMIVTFSRLPVVNAGLDATVDIGASFTVSTATASNYSSVIWSATGSGSFTSGINTLSPTYLSNVADKGIVVILTLTAIPNGICSTPVTDDMLIFVTDHPPVWFNWESSCEGTETYFLIDQGVTNISTIDTYLWDFGDGSPQSSTPEPSHLYNASGIYTVTLTVTDTAGYTNVASQDIEVHPIPVANFNYDQPSCSGLTTQFYDYSKAPSGYILEWYWNFGDGNDTIIYDRFEKDVQHTYSSSGTYEAILTVKTSDSCMTSTSLIFEVSDSPIAAFRYDNACFGALTNLTDESSMVGGFDIVAWSWAFGELSTGVNNYSTEQNPVHQFQAIGNHLVTLTVTNSQGCSNTLIDTVTISSPPSLDFDYAATCLNTPVQFTVDTVTTTVADISNWLWDFGDGITSTLRNPTHTYSVSGTYTVSLTALNINGCSNTVTHAIIVFIAPVANFNFDNPTCSSDSVQFNDFSNTPFGTNITEWKWIFGDGDTITVIRPNNPNIQHRYDSVGTFTVTLIITNSNGCTSSVSRQITTLPSPIADFTYTPACMNELTQFTDVSVPNGGGNVVSWRWNFGDPISTVNNTSTQQNPVHQYNTAGTFTVILLVENTQGCTDTVSHQVRVTKLPGVDFKIYEACIGADVQFNIDSTITPIDSIATYFWDFGDGINSNDKDTTGHTYQTPGTYTVSLTVTDINGCSNTVSHDLSLAALPQSLFGVSESQCNTDPIQFTNFSTTEAGYITEWQWDFGDGNDSIISFPNNPNLSHLYATNGTYTATLTVTNSNGCSNVSTQEIIILPGPIANFDFESVCLDVSARFTDLSQANGGGIITGWNWNFGDPTSGINNSSTLQNPLHLFKTVGDHVVLLTIYNEKGCIDTITKTINISMLPDIDFNVEEGSCLNKETYFTIDSTKVAIAKIQAIWDFGDGTQLSYAKQPTHIYVNTGIYNVTLTIIDSNGCRNSITKEVNIKQLPDVKFDTDAPSCENSVTNFIDLSSRENHIVEWHWKFGDNTADTIIKAFSDPNVSHIYNSPGTYKATLTITTADSCSNTFEKLITIMPSPIANFSATTVCIDHPAQFTDLSQENSGGVIVDRLWNFGDPASGINNSSTRQNPVHQYAVSGTYPVSLTISNAEGCTDTYSDSLIVTIPPPLFLFGSDSIICVNTEAKFRMSNNVNLADVQTILWDFGDPTSSDNNSSAQNPTHIYQTPGEYIVTLTLDNDNCGGSISDTIIVRSRPQARFVFTNACIGSPTVFTDLSLYSDSPIEKWKWDFGIINLLSDTSGIQNPVYTYRALGQHYVSLAVTDKVGCSDKLDSVLIEIFPTPTADFTFLESAQGTLSFTNKSLNADTYEWNFGDGWVSDEINPIHVYDSTNSMISSTYENLELMLISLNNEGCADTATKTYDLYFKGLYIPTAFSPNNPSPTVQVFKPIGVNLKTDSTFTPPRSLFKIEVYSTWNQLLWESSALDENGRPTESWNGTFKGSALPSGVYIWKASGVFKDGTLWKGNDLNNTGSGPTSGTLLLIR